MALQEIKTTIGPYQVLDVIGHGGMATVYKAYQPELDRIVAIKILLPTFVDDAAFRSCFEREARLVARLRHPYIVGIHGVGDEEGAPYLVMEYLQGQTLHTALRQRVRAGTFYTPAEALALLTPIASALDYAHTHGVIHGDLKPENIILTANGPIITDFGLAKQAQEEAASAGEVMGTPSYMSPEQIRAERVDCRSDVYALGILLYELLTGTVPFTGPTPSAVAQAHLYQPPPALATLQPRLAPSPLIEEVVRRAVAKRKRDRWPSAGAMVSALAHAIEASGKPALPAPLTARPVALPETARPGPPRRAVPARLQPPPPTGDKGGRLVLLLPIVVVLIVGLWAVRAWADHGDQVAARPRLNSTTTVPTPTTAPSTQVSGGDTDRAASTTTPTASVVAMESTQVTPSTVAAESTQVTPSPQVDQPQPTDAPRPAAQGATIVLEDSAFRGGWRNRGASVYGGRTATWVYGQDSNNSSMSARFRVRWSDAAPKSGQADLTIEGMDSEDASKTTMRIAVNGTTIFENPCPFPKADRPNSGNWGSVDFPFDASLLRSGTNTVTITNLDPGVKNQPPYIAVDYAVIRLP